MNGGAVNGSPSAWPEILGAIAGCIAAVCSAAGAFYVVISNARTKNALAIRDAETRQELATIKARAEAAAASAASASRQAAFTTQAVNASREERGKQVAELKEGQKEVVTVVQEQIVVSNNYNGKIAATTEATQAAAEATHAVANEVRQIRQELASQPSPPPGQ